jgi:1-acyl-sn-glycerol-3-phosphate acyltransferase
VSIVYPLVKVPARWLLRGTTGLTAHGLEHVPDSGPFLLMPNHLSMVDPFLVQSVCPRVIHAMTKSTQFSRASMRWLLPRLGAFPVRRYRVDPQAVRTLLRLLERGEGACVYPEGERSWDGRLQPFRKGALRVALRAGVPIVPVGIRGSFEVWPRWLKRPRFGGTISVHFGEPIGVEAILDRVERDRRLPEFSKLLRSRIALLAGLSEAEAN